MKVRKRESEVSENEMKREGIGESCLALESLRERVRGNVDGE